MNTLTYREYFNKVYGCWLGKCIAGNIGAPYEGMKQRLNLSYDPILLEKMLPNDDLDLQVLWLEILESRGLDFDSDDLARIFFERCPYAPGEYAYFKKNYAAGIHPPLSGSYNNEVYYNGMGCPIRSEIWACVAPGNPALAAELAGRDGVLDHTGDSVYAEQFLAAMEAMAFFEDDLTVLIEEALTYVPADSRIRRLVQDVTAWSQETKDLFRVRRRIVARYGSAEATTVYQNMGFILAGLLLKGGDFLEMTMQICNCGFDTDCTCATAGALFGILHGAEAVLNGYEFPEITYSLGVKAAVSSGRVRDLAESVSRVGAALAKDTGLNLTELPFQPAVMQAPARVLRFEAAYPDGEPAIGFGESVRIRLTVTNGGKLPVQAPCSLICTEPLTVCGCPDALSLAPGESRSFELTAEVERTAVILPMKNLLTLSVRLPRGTEEYSFGLIGKYCWRICGPFWRNNIEVPVLSPGESYWNYFPNGSEDEQMDAIRFYHTNCQPDIPAELPEAAQEEALLVQTGRDILRLEEHLAFDGQATYFLTLKFCSDREFEAGFQIGYSNPIQFRFNNEVLAEDHEPRRYTPENAHRFHVRIRSGENTVSVRLVKQGADTRFSFNILEGSACSNHITDFSIYKLS